MTIDEATGLARFVITCEIINGDVPRLNRASAQIIVGETTGLRVPIDAIHYLKEDGTESETQGENYIPGAMSNTAILPVSARSTPWIMTIRW